MSKQQKGKPKPDPAPPASPTAQCAPLLKPHPRLFAAIMVVFALVDNKHMAKTDEDTIEDFRNVYDFKEAFDQRAYKIECKS